MSIRIRPAHPNKAKEPNIKIYSRKQDYYDSIQAYGQDSAVVYKRKTLVKRIDDGEYKLVINNHAAKNIFEKLMYTEREAYGLTLETEILIFFCGVVYPCFVYKYKDRHGATKVQFCYSIYDILLTMKLYGSKEQKIDWENKKRKFGFLSSQQEIWVPKIFELSKHLDGNKHLYELHHKLGVPIFAYVKNLMTNVIILNPILKKYKFYKVVDTYTAFQEISMFISGILGGISPPMIEVSNDTKIAKHGYDEWSFRREPWKRKRRNKNE